LLPQSNEPRLPQHVSSAWYLFPFFFGFIGGIIAWAVNKDINPGKARNMLIFGIIWTIVGTIILIAIFAAIFAMLAGIASGGATSYGSFAMLMIGRSIKLQ
jgi:uncharacterized Tic20 family protein